MFHLSFPPVRGFTNFTNHKNNTPQIVNCVNIDNINIHSCFTDRIDFRKRNFDIHQNCINKAIKNLQWCSNTNIKQYHPFRLVEGLDNSDEIFTHFYFMVVVVIQFNIFTDKIKVTAIHNNIFQYHRIYFHHQYLTSYSSISCSTFNFNSISNFYFFSAFLAKVYISFSIPITIIVTTICNTLSSTTSDTTSSTTSISTSSTTSIATSSSTSSAFRGPRSDEHQASSRFVPRVDASLRRRRDPRAGPRQVFAVGARRRGVETGHR